MKIIKKIAPLLLALFVLMQFYRPEKNISQGNHTLTFLKETNPNHVVKSILFQTCYNCHSDNTTYPWYNNIAPASYWLANHVKVGKGHLNFSEWDEYSSEKKESKLQDIIEVMEKKKMPLKVYTWTHKEARLTKEQRNEIIDWAKSTSALYQLNQRPI